MKRASTSAPSARRIPPVLLLVLLFPLALASGCVNVRSWDRDFLADYTMRPDRAPVMTSLREHHWFSREAANGGRSIGGGGCGCN